MNELFNDGQSGEQTELVYYTLEVTTQMTRLGSTVIERCVQVGLVRPIRADSELERYSQQDIARLRKVRRLIYELGLNWAGVEVVMRLTDEIQSLRSELTRLQRG